MITRASFSMKLAEEIAHMKGVHVISLGFEYIVT